MKMSIIQQRLLLLMCLGCALPLPAAAANNSHPCAGVANAPERLACYDTAFPPSSDVREAAKKQATQEFGLERGPEALRNPGVSDAEAHPDSIESRVAKVEYDNRNRRTIVLESGQVWAQVEAGGGGHIKHGDTVVVRKGLIGGFQLISSTGVTLRVRRVR